MPEDGEKTLPQLQIQSDESVYVLSGEKTLGTCLQEYISSTESANKSGLVLDAETYHPDDDGKIQAWMYSRRAHAAANIRNMASVESSCAGKDDVKQQLKLFQEEEQKHLRTRMLVVTGFNDDGTATWLQSVFLCARLYFVQLVWVR